MLTLFRRHVKDCKWKSQKHRNCQCPIAVEGDAPCRMIRKSLDLRSWEAAQKLVRDWEANPEGGGIMVKEACEKFISDALAWNLSEPSMKKVRHLTEERLGPPRAYLDPDDRKALRALGEIAPGRA